MDYERGTAGRGEGIGDEAEIHLFHRRWNALELSWSKGREAGHGAGPRGMCMCLRV